jgi:nitroreductase
VAERADRFTVDGVPAFEALRNPVIDQITQHVSVRHFDTSRPLPEGTLEMMIASAQSAPTSSNFQSWSVIVIRDPEKQQKLMELCDHQAFVGQAPLLLVFCADTYRHRYVTARQGYKFNSDYLDLLLVSSIDSALAAQNASLAAESMGLGTCMIGAIRNKARDVAELLELPKGVYATVGLAVGYPARKNEVRPRLPQSVVVHEDKYSPVELHDKDLEAYDQRMAKTDTYVGRRVYIPSVTPEPDQDTGHYGWLEHTARRMARGNEFRRELAAFLQDHGFSLK